MIDILFSLINFAILCMLVAYVIKKYLIPWLHNELALQKKEHDKFVAHLQSLEKEAQALEVKRQAERNRLIECSEKFKFWAFEQKALQEGREREAQKIAQAMQQRTKTQQKNFETYYLLQETKDQALHEAERELKRYFSESKHADYYMDSITRFMNRVHVKDAHE